MDNKFIEITDVGGDNVLINAAHIVCVEQCKNAYDEVSYVQINFVCGSYLHTYESYEDIKKKIENAGKTFLHGDLYI